MVRVPRRVRLIGYLLGLGGGVLFTALIVRQGAVQVGAAVAGAGWGLVAVMAIHLVRLLSDTIGWLLLLPKHDRLPLRTAYWMHWLGESVNNLLPAARVGGDILLARLAALKGMPLRTATASVLVDITTGVFAKIFFTVTGITLLIAATGRTNLVGPLVAAELIAILAVGGFYGVQRLGIFRWGGVLASRLGNSPNWGSLVQGGEALDQTVDMLYSRRQGVAGCCAFWIVSWVINCGEVWVALHALSLPASFTTAVILESVTQAIRGAMFLVPSALGVQEGGYLVVGGLIGIPGDTALALSLVRRVRELTLGVPGLIAWQILEGRRVWQNRSTGAVASAEHQTRG